ncbi:G-patch domain-containing protein [Loa loa]|uniref:G-patch domain-containing protein n=1 Tax=Loa loa TaxID=7209 RepID=A0A1S0U1Y3_LOALO|nr:G-patch domain-containing protein [Loa loa]EFO24081.2 G-patch domain-containing protein [Loa loa]
MAHWVIYGTELEEPDDATSSFVFAVFDHIVLLVLATFDPFVTLTNMTVISESVSTVRPLGIQDQVVKDEKGRKRFHGAFTGGFSAGYFNTVGSKGGWVPKKFRSSRNERGERIDYKPEDFMDEEDLSEFGIATRRIKTSANIGGDNNDGYMLAWERNMQSSLESSLSLYLQKIIKPTRDSVGIQLLKKMGWREGYGIGSKMSRKALEKQKLNDDRTHRKEEFYNEEAVREADEMAPNFLFAPSDFDPPILKSSEGVHGLGYRGMQHTSVLSEKYGILETALKVEKKGKGISGQAFGVGAFENDDANIYTNYDLSQYDFAIDGSGTTSNVSCSASDTSFVIASKRQLARRFFEPPLIPPNFIPRHTPIHPNISQMPLNITQFRERMNHLQRAKFLGEIDPKPVFELVRDEDRKRLDVPQSEDVIQNAFEEEPMKQARFKQYVNYLKRGLHYPQPSDMTRLEWDQELHDFQNLLPPELQPLILEVEKQQRPLARPDIAASIADVLKSKFISTSSSCSGKMREVQKTEGDRRLAAVTMKMFGVETRSVHVWHPAKQLAKRFNVPDPFPSSNLLGVPCLQKTAKTETLANLGAHMLSFDSMAQDPNQDGSNLDQKPSEEFLKAIFGDSNESSTDTDEELQDNQKAVMVPSKSGDFLDNRTEDDKKSLILTKVLTVMDMDLSSKRDDDNEEFGPAPPPPTSSLTVDLRADINSNKKGKFYFMNVVDTY